MNNIIKLEKYFRNKISNLTPVEWAEENRVLTPDITNWPGPMSYDRTPYLKEIANSIMSSDSGQIFAIMKGSQIGFSIGGIFTMMGWVISQSPANMLFMVNDDAGIKRAMQGPVDQMINSSGISNLIRATNTRGGRNQKTGDTIKGKTFPNGNLYTWSGQAIGSLSQISVKYGFYDELERYPVADKKAGSLISLIEERHKSFSDTRKLYFISTPEIKQTSNIEPIFLKGDQRKYHLPCKCCGEMINLVWYKNVEHLNNPVGVIFDRKSNGELISDSVRYRCQKCGETFDQTHVYDCYENDDCQWIPTSKAISKIYRSYHISALYAPPGMYNWKYYAQKWCEIHPRQEPVKVEELKTFINQCLGQTWEAKSKSIRINEIMKNTFNYDINTIPIQLSKEHGNGGIVLITCAVDLNGLIDDARLDYEVRAWAESGSSYSIDHGSIGTFQRSKVVRSGQAKKYKKNDEDRIKWTYQHGYPNNVWDVFYKDILNRIYETDAGGKMKIFFTGVDTGHFTQYAYDFVNKFYPSVIGLKGPSDNKYSNFDNNKALFKQSSEIKNLYLPEINKIKDNLSRRMELKWDEDIGVEQPDGYFNFPNPSGEKYNMKNYFSHFESEKRDIEINNSGTAISSRWVKKHSSSVNHMWDCFVYNEAVKEIVVSLICKEAKVPVSWNNYIQLMK
jgi:phage terminase large subunit GpA-like protein